MSMESKNSYLEQVVNEQQQLEQDLRMNRAQKLSPSPMVQQAAGGGGFRARPPMAQGPAVDVRITGFWRWKNVIVPPNAYVVHTRRGQAEPVHCGLGISFSFDPLTDSFLVVPATMQTILINARSIVKERQGILIQGYVQWIIEDFKTAYRKLDFSDPVDPMRVVNLQLREQAEAAIKDKVATLGVDDVLADKQPIIRELTARLKTVAEGGEGLGLRIVQVQIKEAVVSSSTLWETLQRPFRAERAKEARLAELATQSVVRSREAEESKAQATEEIETQAAIAARRAAAEATAYDREQAEALRRARVEAESLAARIAFEAEKIAREAELARARAQAELAEAALRAGAAREEERAQIDLEAARRKLDNEATPAALQARLVAALPQIVAAQPKPAELRSISIGSDGLASLVSSVRDLLAAVGRVEPPKGSSGS